MRTYRNRTAGRSNVIHIAGLDYEGNYGPNAGEDMGRGLVEYAPQSACPVVSTHKHWVEKGSFTDLRDAVAAATKVGRTLCRNCGKAAAAELARQDAQAAPAPVAAPEVDALTAGAREVARIELDPRKSMGELNNAVTIFAKQVQREKRLSHQDARFLAVELVIAQREWVQANPAR